MVRPINILFLCVANSARSQNTECLHGVKREEIGVEAVASTDFANLNIKKLNPYVAPLITAKPAYFTTTKKSLVPPAGSGSDPCKDSRIFPEGVVRRL